MRKIEELIVASEKGEILKSHEIALLQAYFSKQLNQRNSEPGILSNIGYASLGAIRSLGRKATELADLIEETAKRERAFREEETKFNNEVKELHKSFHHS